MKTRLSEKAKNRLRKEQISPVVVKRKTGQKNSGTKKKSTSNLYQKGEFSKNMTNTSLSLYSKIKKQSHKDEIAALGTNKKLMMLQCINFEEAKEGNDFVFVVHYVDSADNFAFDSVLMEKQIMDNEKYSEISDKCLEKMKHKGLKNNNKKMPVEQTEITVYDSMVQSCSPHSTKSVERIAEVNTNCEKEVRLSPVQSTEILSYSSEDAKLNSKCVSEDQKASKLQFHDALTINIGQKLTDNNIKSLSNVIQGCRENGDIKTQDVGKNSFFSSQKTLITTDDDAKNKTEFCTSTQNSLKRNLRQEFADAFHQDKDEKRFMVEVGCSDGLSLMTESIQTHNEMNINNNQNGEINAPSKDNLPIFKTISNESIHKSPIKHNERKQVNGKGIEKHIKSPSCFKTSEKTNCVDEKNATENPLCTISIFSCKEKPNIENNVPAYDKNNSTLPLVTLKESDNISDQVTELCCEMPLPVENNEFQQKVHLSTEVSTKSNDPSCVISHKNKQVKFINNRENAEVRHETEFNTSSSISPSYNIKKKTISNQLSEEILLDNQSKNASTLFLKKCLKKPKNKQYSEIKSNKRTQDEIEYPFVAEQPLQSNMVKNSEVNVYNGNTDNSIQEAASTKSTVIIEASPVSSHKRSSMKRGIEKTKECIFEPIKTRSSMKKSRGKTTKK